MWTVERALSAPANRTPGQFSVGYRVVHDDGTSAFMKATDIGMLVKSEQSILENIRLATALHSFERQILDHCRGNNMDRIVVALDYGEFPFAVDGVQDVVFYLVFELAKGDARIQADARNRYGLAWTLHALHNLSIAVRQLHAGRVTHNDIKPANILIFTELLQKLGDLGRATSMAVRGPYDTMHCAGDMRYAAPELLYGLSISQGEVVPLNARRAADIYLLGSMAYFFVTGQMLTSLVHSMIQPEHRFDVWRGTFSEILPYWRQGYSRAMAIFSMEIEKMAGGNSAIAEELGGATMQLCEPDPMRRGHPLNRIGNADRYSVERYVSLFDRLRRLASRT
jgi:serine/threonine protein kinase